MLSVNDMLNEDDYHQTTKVTKLTISNLLCQEDEPDSSSSPTPPYFSNSVASSPSSTSSNISLPSIHSIQSISNHHQTNHSYSYNKTTISNFYNHHLLSSSTPTSPSSSSSHRFYNITDPILSPYDEVMYHSSTSKHQQQQHHHHHHHHHYRYPSSSSSSSSSSLTSEQMNLKENHSFHSHSSFLSTSNASSIMDGSDDNEVDLDDELDEFISSNHPHHHKLMKAKRRRANTKQLEVLNRVFEKTFFPSTQLRAQLGRQLGMSPRTVQIWFQNRRQAIRNREKQPIL
ncbi:unnamed protein product [Cunninghamella blakesleeana]